MSDRRQDAAERLRRGRERRRRLEPVLREMTTPAEPDPPEPHKSTADTIREWAARKPNGLGEAWARHQKSRNKR